MDETCGTPDDNTCFGTQRCLQITLGLEPSALCAFRAVIKLYCRDVSCEWVSCLQMVKQDNGATGPVTLDAVEREVQNS